MKIDKHTRFMGHCAPLLPHKIAVLALTMIMTSACASTGPKTDAQGEAASGGMQGAASDAARQPLRDIGLMKQKIPYALSRIADPYAEPSGPGCVWISYELTQLRAALGSEVAVMPVADRSSNTERGSRMARQTMTDMIRSSGSRLLPGRSVIRAISGANSSEALYQAAKERGMVRRGYLTGLSEAKNCS